MSCLRTPALWLLLAATLATSSCDDGGALSATWALCVEPGEVAFGEVPVRTPAVRTLAVTNCGNVPVEALAAVITADDEDMGGAFLALAVEVPSPLMPGGRFFLPIRFFGSTPGDYEARVELSVPEAGADAVASATLTGRAKTPGACGLVATPETVTFPATEVGQEATQDVTLENTGAAPCPLSGGHTLGDDFAVIESPTAELAAGETTTAQVRFLPTATGDREGSFAIIVAGAREVSVALRGVGLPAERCALALDPDPLTLPRASVGFSTTSAAATLRNVGELPCTLASLAISPDTLGFAIQSAPAVATTLAPGDDAPVIITLTPTTTGALAAALVIETEEGAMLEAALTAFGDPRPTCALRPSVQPLSFPPLAVGLDERRSMTVTNETDLPCSFDAALTDDAGPDFTLEGSNTAVALLPGETAELSVRFAPATAAPAIGAIELTFTDGGQQSIALIGFGDRAELVLTPGLTFFGPITEGCASRPEELLLTNVGAVAARLDSVALAAISDPTFELLTAPLPTMLLGPGEATIITSRLLGAPVLGPHAARLDVLATGAMQPLISADLFGSTESEEDAQRTDSFLQTERPTVDILFVVDNSGSMQQEQQNLATNFGQFIQFTTALDIDYHIGVITTDTDEDGALVAPFISNIGSSATADPTGAFVQAVNVGTTGSATENGLETAVLALTEPALSTTNAGFLREHALLSVIYVSDEDDHSNGDVGDWLDRLLAVKGYDANAVLASAIAGDVPAGCNGNGNNADAGKRYFDVVNGLGGVFASICTPDWSTTMEQLGTGTFSALTRFELTRRPDTATINVEVDGQAVPESDLNGWTFDPATNAITFHGTSVPEAGEQIEISYLAECILP